MTSSPRIKTTVVGSYPVPDWLAAAPSEQGLIDATRVVIATQEPAGVDVVCDGELYRFDLNHPETNGMIEYFVRPMSGIRHDMSFEEVMAYRAMPGMRFRTRPPGVVDGPLGSGTLDLPGACAARLGAGDPDLQVHRHRPAHAGQDAARPPLPRPPPSWPWPWPTCSPSRWPSMPTWSRSTRRTCPAIPRNGSGPPRRSTACSTP